jgi:DUF4097 and DUF4098 domain-containing protein YvlB
VADNHIRVLHGYTSSAAVVEPCVPDTFQKPKGDELTQEFHQAYALSPTGRVGVANINGDVHINVWDQNSVKVDAIKRAYDQQALNDVTIDVTNSPDSVMIKTKYPENNSGNRDRNRSWAGVEYTLTIPRGASLNGAELVNGSLDIEGVQGDVKASLVNGDVKAEGLGGEVKISTVNGGVEANVARLSDAKNVNLSSVNGSLTLIVPAGANADVKASTLHGAITNDFGLTVDEGQYVGRNLSGQIGSGGVRVRLNNVNGSIAIKRSGGVLM